MNQKVIDKMDTVLTQMRLFRDTGKRTDLSCASSDLMGYLEACLDFKIITYKEWCDLTDIRLGVKLGTHD